MPIRLDEPFPLEAVRDLLGVVRAVYGEAKQNDAAKAELERIASIGQELSDAIDLASTTEVGTIGHRAAIQRADEATSRAGELVDAITRAEHLMIAASDRVTGVSVSKRRKRIER